MLVHRMASGQNGVILPRVALLRTHVADAAVPMFDVVPVHETGSPLSRCVQVGEALGRELWSVLCGAKQGLSGERWPEGCRHQIYAETDSR